MDDATRRGFLECVGLGLVGLALGCSWNQDTGEPPVDDTDLIWDTDWSDSGRTCEVTPPRPEGSHYRPEAPVRVHMDLYEDEGTRLRLTIGVLGRGHCYGLDHVTLELWHADPSGVYDDDSPEFRYRARQASRSGGFEFFTVKPGHHAGDDGEPRPAHLHVKVLVEGEEVLTTQLFFPDDPHADDDSLVAPELVGELEQEEGRTHAHFSLIP